MGEGGNYIKGFFFSPSLPPRPPSSEDNDNEDKSDARAQFFN